MTVEEMRKRIEEECLNYDSCSNCPLCEKTNVCFDISATDEEIKENYKFMFGKKKEETEMKNEFDFNELKAGMAIKVPYYKNEILVAIPCDKDRLVFYSKDFENVVDKEAIIKGCQKEFMPIEVYGFSYYDSLFDPSTRPLLWKKEKDMNFKEYKIGHLKISPNYGENVITAKTKGYKTEKENFLFIETTNEDDEYIAIHKSELDDVINALTEIRDFIKED